MKPRPSLITHSTRYGCVGGLINNEPFFCGGEYDTGNKFNDGFVVGQPNKKLQMQEKRFGAAGVGKIKPSFSWSIFIRAVIDHMICYNLNWP